MNIGVVIINYHSEKLTSAFIREECSKISSPHRIVVVDNDSRGELTDLPSEVEVIHSEENLGFARGNNLGAEWLRDNWNPDFILFANNDIRFFSPDVADRMAERLSGLEDAGVIGPEVVGLDQRRQGPEPFMTFSERHLLPYWGKLFYRKKTLDAKLYRDYAESAAEGPHYRVTGAFFMVRAADFFAAGMFDPATFLYGEEAILSERMKAIGRCVWFYPEVRVIHEHGATTRSYYSKVAIRSMKFESESYYFRTYIGTPSWQFALAKFTYFLKRLFRR